MCCTRPEGLDGQTFFMNYGQQPRTMIWDNKVEYPGVRRFAERMKTAIMSAHDSVITSRVRQTEQANKRRREGQMKVGDLVYLSTKDLAIPYSEGNRRRRRI